MCSLGFPRWTFNVFHMTVNNTRPSFLPIAVVVFKSNGKVQILRLNSNLDEMNLILLLAEGQQPYCWTACCAEGGLRWGLRVDIRKVCIATIHGIHSWAGELFYCSQLFLTFPLYSNKKTISPLSHSSKQVLPQGSLSYSSLPCRPLGPPNHSRDKGQWPLRGWLSGSILSSFMLYPRDLCRLLLGSGYSDDWDREVHFWAGRNIVLLD